MSQTTFLESVVSWDHQKCQQNLDEALPKLIDFLQNAEIIQEKVGILKIICQLFLPCIQIEESENKLFRHIIEKACCSFECILNDIKQINKNQDISVLSGQVLGLLELLSDIVECYEVCVKHVGSTEVPLAWNKVQSLPTGAVHILKGTYGHCKGSSELYGELLVHVSEPLSALFRKAHSLQMAFLNLLDKLTVDGNVTDKDIDTVCCVCYGLFEVCQIVTSLDVKLVVTLWKAISKHAVQKKELLRHHLDVDKMIKYLCSEISNGYSYLFQLLPHVDEEGMVLSQGDEKGFQKSVKILGFQMKITVTLVREYSDYLSDCGTDVYKLLIHLQRMMPPSIHRHQTEDHHNEEIKRQLLNATEPLVSCFLTNTKFLQCLISYSTVDDLTVSDSLPHLLLTIHVMNSIPKLSDIEQERWLSPNNHPEDSPTHSLIQTTFYLLNKCSMEVILPVNVPGLSSTSKKDREVCLYDEICVHFCGFIGSLPVKHFHKLEEVLIVNLLSTSPVCSQLATDAWCFLVRYGSAELCDSHVKLLLEIMKNIQGHTIQYRNVTVLVNRMIKFLAKEHQVDIIKLYPLSNHMTLWSALSISGFTSTNARSLVDDIVGHCLKNIHNFINTTEKKPDSFVFLISSKDCLLNIFNDSDVVEKYLLPNAQSTVVEKTVMICNSFSDWLILPITRLCLAKVIHLYSFILPNLNNKEILQILILISTVMTQRPDQYFKLSVAVFLQHLGSVKLSPSFESQILNKIPEIFSSLLSDTNSIIKHKALETFTKFAEITVHESIVPQCIQNDTNIQDSVVAFLNKTPFPSAVKRKDYLINLLNNTDEEDERDDGGQEPSSKRPRTEDCGKSENQQQLIDLLLSCCQGLQENKDAIPNQLIMRLKETRNLIGSFLDKKGLDKL
ncbi:FIGNL1-interacting regulator of recombination and mitosis-like isoform X2 [Mytilus galloprovincialis]|uniref:FIGNL1-interacting regulator of recombination and mitosis-like isoform X2 n=1 Tax=Mytilus galloprovincialis TaxID=29158 RepID=UPI003F7CAB03